MEAAEARLSLHLSKCYMVGNHMSRLKYELLSFQEAIASRDYQPVLLDGHCAIIGRRRYQLLGGIKARVL